MHLSDPIIHFTNRTSTVSFDHTYLSYRTPTVPYRTPTIPLIPALFSITKLLYTSLVLVELVLGSSSLSLLRCCRLLLPEDTRDAERTGECRIFEFYSFAPEKKEFGKLVILRGRFIIFLRSIKRKLLENWSFHVDGSHLGTWEMKGVR